MRNLRDVPLLLRYLPQRWTLPPRTAATRVAALTATWPTGRWFSRDDALAAGLPAPLRKLLLSAP